MLNWASLMSYFVVEAMSDWMFQKKSKLPQTPILSAPHILEEILV